MSDGTDIERLATTLVDSAFAVHQGLGPGLLESAYQSCFSYELSRRGLRFNREVVLPVKYGEIEIDAGYRVDLVVEGLILVENKSVQALAPIHQAQMITYLKLSGLKLGFLINWNVPRIKHGIRRFVYHL
jgi:GxxExxY protein